jgi:hypothetical protein
MVTSHIAATKMMATVTTNDRTEIDMRSRLRPFARRLSPLARSPCVPRASAEPFQNTNMNTRTDFLSARLLYIAL